MKSIALLLFGALLIGLEPRAGGMASAFASDSTLAVTESDSAASVPGSADTPDSSVAAVPQRDVFDLLREYIFHKELEREVGGTTPIGFSWAILPTLSYNPVYGLAVGAMISGAGRRGAESMRFSQLSVSGNISTTGQIQVQARGDVFNPSGNYLLRMDVRYLDTERSTWGLGPISPDHEEYPMDFLLARLYGTLYRRASGPVFVGIGYHYDEFYDIVDLRAEAGETTPFLSYHGGSVSRTVATGLSLNVLGDTRDNLANPSSGYYLSGSFRDYMSALGSDDNWQEMWIEMRVYPHLPSRSRNVLAFWLYSWMTFGPAPYLNLPSNGWDMYGRGSRGYLQGRIRGANQVYLESEYRWALTRDGLWGAVVFLNGASTTDPESGIFGRPDWAAGTGLRIKFNKTSNTNLAIDYGWGTQNSSGFFLGMSEVF
jgi:hypothetical protein